MKFRFLEVKTKNNTVTLRLNRPEVKNALNLEMTSEILDALDYFEKQPGIRFLVLEGNGAMFCSGADLNWMKKAGEKSYDKNFEESLLIAKCINRLYNAGIITIARIHGGVYGGGIGLMAACDFIYAETSAVFSFSEVKLGLVPAIVSPYVLQKTGMQIIRELMLTGRIINGMEAKSIGLINNCFDDSAMIDTQIDKLITELSEAAPLAQREIKLLLNKLSGNKIDKTIVYETSDMLTKIRSGAEAQEGIDAFLQKIQPSWIR